MVQDKGVLVSDPTRLVSVLMLQSASVAPAAEPVPNFPNIGSNYDQIKSKMGDECRNLEWTPRKYFLLIFSHLELPACLLPSSAVYAVFGGLPPVLLPSLREDQPSLDGPGLCRRFHRDLGLLRARSLLHVLLQQRRFSLKVSQSDLL